MLSINKPVIVLVGPTAVGKTELSLQLAAQLNAEIVSADSRLVYRGMDIGTAKPSIKERTLIPHHIIDIIDPDEPWSLADFQQAAGYAVQEIHQKEKIPLLVGGTGQYIKAILEQWEIPKHPPNPALRNFLSEWSSRVSPQKFHNYLALLDPVAANFIDPTNSRRVIRALEVILQSGRKFSEQRKKGIPPYHFLILGLHRHRLQLYQRIDQRIDKMLENGFIEEVKGLLSQGYSPNLPSMSAIGYQQIISYLQGIITLDEAIQIIRRSTRNFVRRQANWFKFNDPSIHWFSLQDQDKTIIIDQILLRINQFLYENQPT